MTPFGCAGWTAGGSAVQQPAGRTGAESAGTQPGGPAELRGLCGEGAGVSRGGSHAAR